MNSKALRMTDATKNQVAKELVKCANITAQSCRTLDSNCGPFDAEAAGSAVDHVRVVCQSLCEKLDHQGFREASDVVEALADTLRDEFEASVDRWMSRMTQPVI